MGKWYQGKYKLKHPEKYIGHDTPIYRSSWEARAFSYCDNNKNVLAWGSEIVVIPYFYDIDQKMHKYYTDLYMEVKDRDGVTRKYIVEIKPKDQTTTPKPPKRKTAKSMKNYRDKVLAVRKNECKWEAARQFCKKKGYQFKIITEDHLF